MRISEMYQYPTTPKANDENIVKGDKYRFTVLTSRLIRAEYNEKGVFDDSPTQIVVNRAFPPTSFKKEETDEKLVITTSHIELVYYKKPFSKHTLFVRYTGGNSSVFAGDNSSVWGFTTENLENLKGTARTLDNVNGPCVLEDGLMSRSGKVTVLDDSNSLIIADDGWVDQREEKYTDTYLFCYGDAKLGYDYKACLKDFYTLTGNTPLVPKYVLGNWWSRYHPYTQEEYTELMTRFKAEDIPFSVAVIDMDWHYVKIDPKYGTGWTGYSWNKELFPDHKALLKFLADENLEVCLNLHPQQGVAGHEDAYEAMATAMGIDPKTEKTVEFDITNPKFMENYFKHLHHPLEKEGVGFWWMDWQQANNTRIEGLDPLWMLNHYHYVDNDKAERRPLMFSRYSGPGSHRYPIGFSGDTHITWESLDFQPYFTSTASNIGYGWWSHDIGGHMCGSWDHELIARWVQLGVFSPINRLHSTRTKFTGKEPWKFNKICEASMKKFLKLRYQMMPYIYSMNYRASELGEPIIMPMYYNWNTLEAYNNKNEYTFGTEMLVKPITSPADKSTAMGSTEVWFPEGEWYDLFTNRKYSGGKSLRVYRDLYEMPVFVKAGGIVPMCEPTNVNGIENPEILKIKVFAGSDNTFCLYEDDGKTKAYKDGAYTFTKMELDWSENPTFKISKPTGDLSVIPANRKYEIEFIGIKMPENIKASGDFKVKQTLDTFVVETGGINEDVVITLEGAEKADSNMLAEIEAVMLKFEYDTEWTRILFDYICTETSKTRIINHLSELDIDKNVCYALTEIIVADE